MPKAPKGLLFDLDGTLLDTAHDLGNTLNYLLQAHGLEQKSYAEYSPFASHGAKGLLELGFNNIPEEEFTQLREEFLAHYAQNICIHTVLYEGVSEVIEYCQKHQIPWGIVTNKPGFLTTPLLTYFPVLASAQSVISADTLPQRKPHPQPLLFAAQQLQVEPNDIWYIGDAERDMQAANSANMFSVLATYGYIHTDDQIEQWHAQLHINKIVDILDYIK
ncbi:HAD-IA family hydrolase [Alteromonadaceae bacterium BrNp21-10]|nr:HAD-IA family hydrolase [Alteromonadaceae bacterium BrNp21-10]